MQISLKSLIQIHDLKIKRLSTSCCRVKNCVIVKKVTFDGDIKSDYGLSRLLANTSLGDNAAILKATDKKAKIMTFSILVHN